MHINLNEGSPAAGLLAGLI
uniref:Uncharacterized protein n=1 Tax=Anguilla anguilla TaxID=7936 RepID=A0A0E9TZK6_ANGAN